MVGGWWLVVSKHWKAHWERWSDRTTSPNPPTTNHQPRAGFTLIEMSIVLLIIGIVVGSGIKMLGGSLQKRQYQETKAKLTTIQEALLHYRMAFDRIPCPADVTLAISNANFGVEGATPGTCTGGTPAANATQSIVHTGDTHSNTTVDDLDTSDLLAGMRVSGSGIPNNTTIASVDSGSQITLSAAATTTVDDVSLTFVSNVIGMVPTTTLRLPDDYAFDGWGRRMMYAVTRDLTATGGFTAVSATNAARRFTIAYTTGSNKITDAAYVLVSMGPNGHGAYPRVGGSTRINTGSTNTDEQNNCDCSSSAVASGLNGVFVDKAPVAGTDVLAVFDDVIAYGTRMSLRLPTE